MQDIKAIGDLPDTRFVFVELGIVLEIDVHTQRASTGTVLVVDRMFPDTHGPRLVRVLRGFDEFDFSVVLVMVAIIVVVVVQLVLGRYCIDDVAFLPREFGSVPHVVSDLFQPRPCRVGGIVPQQNGNLVGSFVVADVSKVYFQHHLNGPLSKFLDDVVPCTELYSFLQGLDLVAQFFFHLVELLGLFVDQIKVDLSVVASATGTVVVAATLFVLVALVFAVLATLVAVAIIVGTLTLDVRLCQPTEVFVQLNRLLLYFLQVQQEQGFFVLELCELLRGKERLVMGFVDQRYYGQDDDDL